MRRNAAMRAPLAQKGAHGTAPDAAQFGVLMCPPMASELPLRENGDFGRSPIYGQLSHKYVGVVDVKHNRRREKR
jgi:hypothetical protein